MERQRVRFTIEKGIVYLDPKLVTRHHTNPVGLGTVLILADNSAYTVEGKPEDIEEALSPGTSAKESALQETQERLRALEAKYGELSEMHSQLSKLNVERQKAINALVEMAKNLYAITCPFMSEGDSVWLAMQEEYVAAMDLAGEEPKL